MTIVNAALPAIHRALDFGGGDGLAWVVDGYSLGYGGLLLARRVTDLAGAGAPWPRASRFSQDPRDWPAWPQPRNCSSPRGSRRAPDVQGVGIMGESHGVSNRRSGWRSSRPGPTRPCRCSVAGPVIGAAAVKTAPRGIIPVFQGVGEDGVKVLPGGLLAQNRFRADHQPGELDVMSIRQPGAGCR